MDDWVGDALDHSCVADASLLGNFIHIGKFFLLHKILGRPVQVTPAVLDVEEVELFKSTSEIPVEPTSEIFEVDIHVQAARKRPLPEDGLLRVFLC